MEKTVTALFVLVGIIHLLPVVGVLGGERLSALYGLPLEAPDIAILMTTALYCLAYWACFLSMLRFILPISC